MSSRYLVLLGLIALVTASCTKPYSPKVTAGVNNYLVVEGVINTGNDSTVIKLTRTVNLTAGVRYLTELNATVAIQDDQNQTYNLTEKGNGFYVSPVLNLDNTRKYRLSITTSDGKSFLSDYQASKTTPPIDSIGFATKSNGLQIYVNTHDPNNNTHYYRWDYTETWQFHSRYQSLYISNNVDDMVKRTPAQGIYQCWGNSISTNIVLGSSAKLAQDVIYQSPITFISSSSEKIETRYSIILREYALSTDAYNYFTLLKKNTEELGSIFDAQPSQLTGNVHCTTDVTLPVIGFVTVGTIQQKRVYIDNTQVPQDWFAQYPYDCTLDTLYYVNPINGAPDVLLRLVPPPHNILATTAVTAAGNGPATIVGYGCSSSYCVDCTLRGTAVKPSFWK